MSIVISFRLSKENLREARAYEILKAWQGKGYGNRHTITQALLRLDDRNPDPVRGEKLDEINEALSQVCQMLEQMQNGDNAPQKGYDASTHSLDLADNFIASIENAAKPGMKLD